MLPAWATVTITLGGALITGLATGLVAVYGSRTTVKVARLQLDQTHRETWAAETRRVRRSRAGCRQGCSAPAATASDVRSERLTALGRSARPSQP